MLVITGLQRRKSESHNANRLRRENLTAHVETFPSFIKNLKPNFGLGYDSFPGLFGDKIFRSYSLHINHFLSFCTQHFVILIADKRCVNNCHSFLHN
jgi:hypothetical protein